MLERALFIDALQVIESKDLPFIQDHRRIFPVHRLGLDVQQAKGQKDVVFIHARLPRSVDHLLFDEMEPMIADEELRFVREEPLTFVDRLLFIVAEPMIDDARPVSLGPRMHMSEPRQRGVHVRPEEPFTLGGT